MMVDALELKAKAFVNLYMAQSNNSKDLKAALSTYDLAAKLIYKIRISYQSENSQLKLLERAFDIDKQAIALASLLYRKTRRNEYVEKAFGFSEGSKSALLIQSLSDADAKKYADIPDELLEQEKDIKAELFQFEKRLIEEKSKGKLVNASRISFWQDRIFDLKQRKDSLTHKFEIDYPEYFDLKYRNFMASPRELQKKVLRQNDVIVEYFIGDGAVYIFTLTKQDLHLTVMQIDTAFSGHVRSMRDGLMKRDYSRYTENAYKLYRILVEPIRSKIAGKNLIIIPDGLLGYIPFETLLTKKADKQGNDYRQLAYLIREHRIAYDYSATLLYENMIKGRNQPAGRYIGFAPVIFK
jgi:hypothetical protein